MAKPATPTITGTFASGVPDMVKQAREAEEQRRARSVAQQQEAVDAFRESFDSGALNAHPDADLFPMLREDDLESMKKSLQEIGLQAPILIDREGRIADGRNRARALYDMGYRASLLRGHGLRFAVPDPEKPGRSIGLKKSPLASHERQFEVIEQEDGESDDAYQARIKQIVSAANLERRHLTFEERKALVPVLLASTAFGRPKAGSRAPTAAEVAKKLDMSVATVERVKAEAKAAKSPSIEGLSQKPAVAKITVKDTTPPATIIARPEVHDASIPAYTATAQETKTEVFQTPADALMVERLHEAQAGLADALGDAVLAVPSPPAPAPALPPHAVAQVLAATDQDMSDADIAAVAIQKIIDASPALSDAILDALFRRKPTLAAIARQLTANPRSGSDRR